MQDKAWWKWIYLRCDCYVSGHLNVIIKSSLYKTHHAENTVWFVHFPVESGVNGGLSCGTVCWRNEDHDQSSGGLCGVCEWASAGFMFCLHPAHCRFFSFLALSSKLHILICIHQQLHLQNWPVHLKWWRMCILLFLLGIANEWQRWIQKSTFLTCSTYAAVMIWAEENSIRETPLSFTLYLVKE